MSNKIKYVSASLTGLFLSKNSHIFGVVYFNRADIKHYIINSLTRYNRVVRVLKAQIERELQ